MGARGRCTCNRVDKGLGSFVCHIDLKTGCSVRSRKGKFRGLAFAPLVVTKCGVGSTGDVHVACGSDARVPSVLRVSSTEVLVVGGFCRANGAGLRGSRLRSLGLDCSLCLGGFSTSTGLFCSCADGDLFSSCRCNSSYVLFRANGTRGSVQENIRVGLGCAP